ncbi:polyprenyl glycosylphosphotransferase [Bacillus sp. AFS076308]|uniref:sugar transferase n=1 Tax=unclassified Bacillus (in: firmicutes) TaxID=185979 RepID=UPI000BF6C910|nr:MULTISPECIES: sugar transferase [unclassified Bacillus (in: firmicutes)]PFO04939.1 polyprenyl glycosylphosphotransferase [Bacillus sp. AFS076308]PGV51036.1 polyprenyl glycosylphosphotransferase [Bacillus sp. AFS037270]
MNEDYKGSYVKFILAIVDIALVYAGFFLSNKLLQQFSILQTGVKNDFSKLIVLSACSVFVMYFYDLYADWRRKSSQHLVYSIVLSMVIFTGFELIITEWSSYLSYPISYIILAFLIQTILLVSTRIGIWYVNKKLFGKKKVYIIEEDSNTSLHLAEKFLNHDKGWFEIEGFVSIAKKGLIPDYVKQCDLILISPTINNKDKEEIINLCIQYGKEVMMVPQFFELSVLSANTQQIDDMLVVSIKPPQLSVSQQFYKRMFDIIVSFIILVITSPFFLVLFLLIPLTSRGAALYKQERIGLNGKPYSIYKFRSMVQDAEKRTGPVLALDRDPRITLIGRFIRAVRLDELPQLLNVIKGQMSLVGPRPEREFFISQFKQKYPEYSYRLKVKPGITGLAQVLGNYTTPVDDKLRFDLLYVRNYSFWLDLKILFQTFRVVLQREQAQGVKETNIQNQKILKTLEQTKVINH